MLTQILREKPRSHCRAPLRLPLPRSHCNATTADRTATSHCLFLISHMLSQANALCNGLTCTTVCAITFVPMYSECRLALDNYFDTMGSDKVSDGNASSLVRFDTKCRARLNQDKLAVVARLDTMLAQHCQVDMSQIYASPTASSARKCHDDSRAMQLATTFSCAQVAQRGMCRLIPLKILPDLCSCSCESSTLPVSMTSSRRQLQTNKCPIDQFTPRFAMVTKLCCANGNCGTGVPIDCSYSCAKQFPQFFDDCSLLIQTQAPNKMLAYKAFATLCTQIPVDKMAVAISRATCNTAATPTQTQSKRPTTSFPTASPTCSVGGGTGCDECVLDGEPLTKCMAYGLDCSCTTAQPTRLPTPSPTAKSTHSPTRHATRRPARRPTQRPTWRPQVHPGRPTKHPTTRHRGSTRTPVSSPTTNGCLKTDNGVCTFEYFTLNAQTNKQDADNIKEACSGELLDVAGEGKHVLDEIWESLPWASVCDAKSRGKASGCLCWQTVNVRGQTVTKKQPCACSPCGNVVFCAKSKV